MLPAPEPVVGQTMEVWLRMGQEHAPLQRVQVVPMVGTEEAKWFAGQGPTR